MMFYIFIKACKKYEFEFMLSTCGCLSITLHPRNVFDTMNISQGYCTRNFNKLFLDAIKEMKKYRKKRGVT